MYKINVKVPNGKKGIWEISSFTINKEDAERFNFYNQPSRAVQEGNYKKLVRYTDKRGDVIMSNTPAEIRDHMPFINKATGNVLIFGLGLGMVIEAIYRKKEVHSITVIERDADVIALSGEYYKNISKKVKIIQADAFEYRPQKGALYNAVWFDIWDAICSDNWKEMKTLKAAWRKNVAKEGVMMCWVEKECYKLYLEEEALFERFMRIENLVKKIKSV